MKVKQVDPRTRWVYHVTGILSVGAQQMHTDRCFITNYRLDHEQRLEVLRALICESIEVKARGENGAVIVGLRPDVTFIYAQTPKLIRMFLDESAPAPGPVLVQ